MADGGKPLQSTRRERPSEQMDLDPIGPPRAGRCAWCNTKLTGQARETCSPKCRRAFDSYVRSVGIPIAKRMIVMQMHRTKKPMPKRAKRAFSEMMSLGRRAADWLKRNWEDPE